MSSNQSMAVRYLAMFNLKSPKVLYKSNINDEYRIIITRWRLSCHKLYIETGRYKTPKIPREERLCLNCDILEDENHSIFQCKAHRTIRKKYENLLRKYNSVHKLLDPNEESDIRPIADFLAEIESNMEKLGMIR